MIRALAFVLFLPLFSGVSQAAILIYSNDVLGELEPCGCRGNPAGGMVRKAAMLSRLDDRERLQLDGGDLLFPATFVPPALAEQSELQAKWLLKALDQTGMDAAVPGEKDFALGVKSFEKLIRASKIRFLAANLKKKKGSTFLEPSAIFTRKGADGKKLKIAVIGLVGKDLSWPKELTVSDPIKAAKAAIVSLRKSADLVIALTHQGYEADLELAKAVPGIDAVVGAHSQSFLQDPTQVGETWIFQSSYRNQHIGVLPLKKPLTLEGHRLVELGATYEEENAMTPLVRDFKASIAKLNTGDASRTAVTVTKPLKSRYQTFTRCAECHWKQFDFWRKTPHGNALETLVKAGQQANKECLSCHSLGLGHKDAFHDVTKMAEIRKGDGEEEVTFVGHEDLAPFLKAMHEAKSLKDEIKLTRSSPGKPLQAAISGLGRVWPSVQCESCHGPGENHPFSGTYTKKVETKTCLQCHTAERAPKWYSSGKPAQALIESKRAAIACPAGDDPSEDL